MNFIIGFLVGVVAMRIIHILWACRRVFKKLFVFIWLVMQTYWLWFTSKFISENNVAAWLRLDRKLERIENRLDNL